MSSLNLQKSTSATWRAKDSVVWHQATAESVAAVLDTSICKGLLNESVRTRLEIFGSNEIIDSQQRLWSTILLAQFQSSLIVLLLFAALVSLALGEFTDSIAVITIILLNTLLGFWQDFSAEKSLAELKKLSTPEVSVRRNGKTAIVSAAQLVPGDIVLLQTGYFVPADCRIVEQSNLSIDESALTGESVAVQKTTEPISITDLALGDQTNIGFAGTIVVRGHGLAIVTDTGMQTEIGKVASSLKSVTPEPTPLQTKLSQLSKTTGNDRRSGRRSDFSCRCNFWSTLSPHANDCIELVSCDCA